jgi:hypothetical protein
MSTNQPAAPAPAQPAPAKPAKVKKAKVKGGTKRAADFIIKAGQRKSQASTSDKGLKQTKGGNPFIVKR